MTTVGAVVAAADEDVPAVGDGLFNPVNPWQDMPHESTTTNKVAATIDFNIGFLKNRGWLTDLI